MPTDTQALFNTIAKKYELVNALISLGSHGRWAKKFIREVVKEKEPHRVLDLCSGTGSITRCLLRELIKQKKTIPLIDCVDFSEAMLSIAQEKLLRMWPQSHVAGDPLEFIRCIQAPAEELPLPSQTYDTICLAYGIRNIQDTKTALIQAARVLKPSGTIHILELTQPQEPITRFCHTLYLRTVVPIVGGVITGTLSPYSYLRDSIRRFSVPLVLQQLQDAGFQNVLLKTYTLGTITYIRAQKP